MQIMAVDDDPVSLAILVNVLAKAGHEVLTASDGEEALRKLTETGCRMVISDWSMPGMDGEAFCRAVRQQDAAGYVYFILLTSNGTSDYSINGLSAGADDFLSKPFNPGELIARVRAGERVLSLESRDMALFAMAKLAESRDPETGSHLERIQSYSRVLAQHLLQTGIAGSEVTPEFVRLIHQTSPLHDIGKVGIPDTVLLKPGRLSEHEFAIMTEHTLIGERTLDAALQRFPAAQFLRMARDIAGAHHERFDGTGYPRRLTGRDIPLAARIVTVADVYDALTSKRVYKQAFAHEITRAMILQETGIHFDPILIEAFLSVEKQFLEIREQFQKMAVAAA